MSLVGVKKLTTLSFQLFMAVLIIRIFTMGCCDPTDKKQREPRKKRAGPYQKVNAYTQKPSLEQFITLILFLAQLAGHSVFLVPTLQTVNETILWTLLGFHYALLMVIVHDYIYLTTKDPVDILVVNEELASKYSSSFLKLCLICDSQVHKNSHHCMRCNRCTEQFDHHCRFLNNCIGSRNYQAFFRLLLVYTFYNINFIGMGIWTATKCLAAEDSVRNNGWGIVASSALTLLIEVAVASLLAFHFYISCFENVTTFEHNYEPRKSSDVVEKININLWEAPVSGHRIRRQEGKALY